MHELLILSRHANDYLRLIASARLADLRATTATDPRQLPAHASRCDVVLGEPSLIRVALPALTGARWVQSTWAGIEPLLDSSLRRDYVLTNARAVFGSL